MRLGISLALALIAGILSSGGGRSVQNEGGPERGRIGGI